MAHARVLAGIQDVEKQLYLYRKSKSEDLSVRQMEEAARQLTTSQASTAKAVKSSPASIELERIKKEISSLLGTKVDILRNDKGKGKIVINFGNDKEFNDIYDIFREIDQ